MVERESGASRLFNILNYVFLAFIGIICLYPFLYVVFASFSDPNQFIKHDLRCFGLLRAFHWKHTSMCSQVNWVPAI